MVLPPRRRLVRYCGRIARLAKNQSGCRQQLVAPLSPNTLRSLAVPYADTTVVGRGRLAASRLATDGIATVVPHRATTNSPSDADDIDRTSDAPITLSSLVEGRKTSPAGSGDLVSIPSDGSYGNIPVDESEYRERSVKRKYANTDIFEGGIFENTSEALFALVEMKRRIREQNLDLDSTVDLVIGLAQQMTRCCGIAVGFLPRKRLAARFETVGRLRRKGLHFHANLFQSTPCGRRHSPGDQMPRNIRCWVPVSARRHWVADYSANISQSGSCRGHGIPVPAEAFLFQR